VHVAGFVAFVIVFVHVGVFAFVIICAHRATVAGSLSPSLTVCWPGSNRYRLRSATSALVSGRRASREYMSHLQEPHTRHFSKRSGRINEEDRR
jgi:hypothetical protein